MKTTINIEMRNIKLLTEVGNITIENLEQIENGVVPTLDIYAVELSYEHPNNLYYLGKYIGENTPEHTKEERDMLQAKYEYDNDL